ncbi:hypothetical protein [Nitrosomonas sp. ANs5]|uniref:hypothetical protein n=1 Tax=Nitrosomonas sp. ANs5 TaxID=3423941 RepID=UPI003D3409FD
MSFSFHPEAEIEFNASTIGGQFLNYVGHVYQGRYKAISAMIGKSSRPEWLQTDWILGTVWEATEAGCCRL